MIHVSEENWKNLLESWLDEDEIMRLLKCRPKVIYKARMRLKRANSRLNRSEAQPMKGVSRL